MDRRPDFATAWNAWRTLKRLLPDDAAGRRTLDAYFGQALDLRAGPATEKAQVCTQVEPEKAQVRTQVEGCPDPVIWGGDQYKCPKCGRLWDFNDERPNCTEG